MFLIVLETFKVDSARNAEVSGGAYWCLEICVEWGWLCCGGRWNCVCVVMMMMVDYYFAHPLLIFEERTFKWIERWVHMICRGTDVVLLLLCGGGSC